jgi:FRG domain
MERRRMSECFNYISFGNREHIEGEIDPIVMNRGRMFEYTPTDIEKRLEALAPESINFLEQLPTFLCSEIDSSGGRPSMIVKYGRIENTTPSRKEVSTTFNTRINFGEVSFTTVEQARNLFGADKFQLYRTHWAVREGDTSEILAHLAQLKPLLADAVTLQLEPDLALIVAEPPPRTKNTIGNAQSVKAFLQLLYNLPAIVSTETFFRGHEDGRFELTPSLLRKWPNGAWQFTPNEDRLCMELLIAHYDEFQADQYCFDRLVRMQHYGLPTRLLDISGNPLVALFFACDGATALPELDGEVIVFRVLSDKVKYYDSDTVSCIANLSNFTYAQKSEIDLKLDTDAFNNTGVALKLLHHIKSEKGFFESRIVPDDLGSIICVKAKQTNRRIKSQSGAFLLFGHEATLPESGQEGIEISRITISNKQHILSQLNSININVTTVYPSIDRTAIHLKERYRQQITQE